MATFEPKVNGKTLFPTKLLNSHIYLTYVKIKLLSIIINLNLKKF